MNPMRGPSIFLAQFVRDQAPFNTLEGIAAWVAGLGYVGLQIPTWDRRVFDLDEAARSQAYCDDISAMLSRNGLTVSELAAPLQGQVIAFHPAYRDAFQPFSPKGLSDTARIEWAAGELRKVIAASVRFKLKTIPTLSGGLAWPFAYPWPQRPPGLIVEAFEELARRWLPLLDQAAETGLSFAFEPHPGSDIFDGATFEMFLEHTNGHAAACLNFDPSHLALQSLDYVEFIRLYGSRIHGFHVKDAELRPNGRVGVYGGYQDWRNRAGRFRSLGDGQVDFTRIFTALLEAGYRGWAVLEWECCIKAPEQGAAEGAPFIAGHMIEPATVAFDDFAGGDAGRTVNRSILGLPAEDTAE
jgi:sugar phosphate isomerase/epimerase